MSATPGKVCVQGITELRGEKAFALSFIQARDPSWVGKVFFARYDAKATWLDDLVPAFGEREFFFEPGMRALQESGGPAWIDNDEAEESAS